MGSVQAEEARVVSCFVYEMINPKRCIFLMTSGEDKILIPSQPSSLMHDFQYVALSN